MSEQQGSPARIPYSVLVVDDVDLDRTLMTGLLARDPLCSVTGTTDGAAALQMLERQPVDLVLTDLLMPNMNGLELVKAVRERFPSIPVLLITGQGSEDIAATALQAGAASYVPKRRLSHTLLETVTRVLNSSRAQHGYGRLLNCMKLCEQNFELQNDLRLVSALVSYVQQGLRSLKFGHDADRVRVGVALEEALVNAYYHGNLEVSSNLREENFTAFYDLARERLLQSPYRDRRIFVHSTLSSTELMFEIRDEGRGFDPAILPDPTDPRNIDRPCGRGLLLIRTFMDEVRFNERGNAITITKRLPPAS